MCVLLLLLLLSSRRLEAKLFLLGVDALADPVHALLKRVKGNSGTVRRRKLWRMKTEEVQLVRSPESPHQWGRSRTGFATCDPGWCADWDPLRSRRLGRLSAGPACLRRSAQERRSTSLHPTTQPAPATHTHTHLSQKKKRLQSFVLTKNWTWGLIWDLKLGLQSFLSHKAKTSFLWGLFWAAQVLER